MEAILSLKGLVIGALIAFFLLRKCVSSIRHSIALRKYGCCTVTQYPHKDPFFGYDLYRILRKSRRQNTVINTLQWLFDTYGNGKTFQALNWGIPTIHSADPRIFHAVLQERIQNFGVSPFRKPLYNPWICRGLLVSDGQEWKTSRSMLRPLFQKSQHADLPALEVHVQSLIASIPSSEATFDIQPLFCDMVCNTSLQLSRNLC